VADVTKAAVREPAISVVPKESTHAVGSNWWTRVERAGRWTAGRRRSAGAFVQPRAVGTAAAGRSIEEVANFWLRHGRNENPEDLCQFNVVEFLEMRFVVAGSEAHDMREPGTAIVPPMPRV
jgi:hypothetical protein